MTTASGNQASASSNGFYVDTTPPMFDTDFMSQDIYYDVFQGESVPVRFQASNTTIKAVWRCTDNESEIVVSLFVCSSVFLARLHFSAEELLLYPRPQRPCWRPQNVRANFEVLEF